ncbi:TIR domain-containing protein [Psychrilyobacter atlanticus]|uniref:TIR domain-containing protein n=1 Tax=Psychrilyobacter atlanticus TaxID=271091 RepID=UPI0003F95E1E|nr:TIR domain-containing protein [Psychrilyobacter atlanticus]
MGKKIFISYKYADRNVKELENDYWVEDPRGVSLQNNPRITTVRSYVNKVQGLLDIKEHTNKGERDNEDLSHLSEANIRQKLKTKIHNSSVTIVFISPEMNETLKKDREQWIPWEISYSLKEVERGGLRGRTNAILAVALPDRKGSYNYFENCDGTIKTHNLFNILANNMDNRQPWATTNEKSFIKTIKWNSFIRNINNYIEKAVEIMKNINQYDVSKEV